MLVGGINQGRLAGLSATQHEHVVFEVTNHDSVDFGLLVTPVEDYPGYSELRVIVVAARPRSF